MYKLDMNQYQHPLKGDQREEMRKKKKSVDKDVGWFNILYLSILPWGREMPDEQKKK